MSKEAIIIGYSSHAYVVLDVLFANNYKVMGYCDLKETQHNPHRLTYLGVENDPGKFGLFSGHDIFICIGLNNVRKSIFESLSSKAMIFPSVAHPRSIISPSVEIMQGVIIMPGTIINAYAKIGNAVICNSGAVIEHECIIGDYSHIAPGATLAGNVTVGKGSFIGANSVVKQGIKIGENVTIGAGSVIINDIPDNSLVYGNPGRVK